MNQAIVPAGESVKRAVRFKDLGRGCFVAGTENGPNTGVIVGSNAVMVIDAQPNPAWAEEVLSHIGERTGMPVKYLVLTHYHALNTQSAKAFDASEIIASDLTRRLFEERGRLNWDCERTRQNDLVKDAGAPYNPVSPTMSLASSLAIDLGGCEVRLMHLGRGHTMGDLVVWVPDAGVMYVGDLVASGAACYCGDAHLGDWPRALNRIMAFRPSVLVPSNGTVASGAAAVEGAIERTASFIALLLGTAGDCVGQGKRIKDTFIAVNEIMAPVFGEYAGFEETLPHNVARAYDEAHGLDMPQVWTPERDRDLRDALGGLQPVTVIGTEPGSVDEDSSGPQSDFVLTDSLPDLEQREADPYLASSATGMEDGPVQGSGDTEDGMTEVLANEAGSEPERAPERV